MRTDLVLLTLLLGLMAAVARAQTPPAHVTDSIPDARLAGIGKYTWYGLHVYDARLYVPEAGIDRRDPAGAPFALELTYQRALSGRAIADASRDEIERLDFGSAESRARWHAQMLDLFPNVERDHALAGVNLPGRGVRFYLDGKALGSIDDTQFARAFFGIWLDERTSAPRLRERLLKQAAVG